MPKIDEAKKLTKAITIKLTKCDFDKLQALSDRQQLTGVEWARARLLEALNGPSPSPSDHALMAEITATQDMLIDLFCALGRDGKLIVQTAKEIMDAAHKHKYRDVAALFRYASSRLQTARDNISLRDKSTGGN